ncbi:MAG TPA: thiopurine S-methyltransferase, partial [Chromatiales bacterium]|nr:thiopurine S-methyltransferase [Chromatiales bacterium]
MEPEFWLARWEAGQTGFHRGEVNPLLLAHWDALGVPEGGTVFVPLCGKSRDMAWLAGRGHPVVGVELSPIAVRGFFAEHGLEPA